MRRHAAARVQIKAQWCGSFYPVQIDHFTGTQCGDVAALTQLVHQVAQYQVAGAVQAAVEQKLLGQAAQARASTVLAAVSFALQQARRFELRQHAVQAGFGQACGQHQVLQ